VRVTAIDFTGVDAIPPLHYSAMRAHVPLEVHHSPDLALTEDAHQRINVGAGYRHRRTAARRSLMSRVRRVMVGMVDATATRGPRS
jgi:hypothetical protein